MRDSYIITVILLAALLGICIALAAAAYLGSYRSSLREVSEEQPHGDVCMSYEEFYMLRCMPRERGVIDGCYGVDGGINE